jgi:hypothetical protein
LAILYNGARATGAAKKQSGSSALHAVDTEWKKDIYIYTENVEYCTIN